MSQLIILAEMKVAAIMGGGILMNLNQLKKYHALVKWSCILLIGIAATIWSALPSQTQLETILNQGALRVAARSGPLTYYERDEVPNGLDYNILEAFANDLGVGIEIEIYDDLTDQLESLNSENPNQLAAATLSVTDERLLDYQFSLPYTAVDTLLIQHNSHDRPKDLNQVVEEQRSIIAITGSAHTELLRTLSQETTGLNWEEESGTLMFQLMERVQNQEIDMAVIDSSIFDLEGSLFPKVEVALTLKQTEPIAFAFAQNEDNSLLDALDEFLKRYKASGELDTLLAIYLDPEPSIDVASSLLFNRRIAERLPEYENLFKSVADEYGYNWVMLAAQAYQESHWNATARSPTGVRGLMMLTLPTARQLGVNRLDAVESLEGGMRYLISLRDRLPERIEEPNRIKFALAAYNVGYYHLMDARILTERGGDDPDQWTDVQKYLPLLRQREHFSTVKYGFARGTEPVYYVNNIYRYANILEWYAWQKEIENEALFVDVLEAVAPEEEPTNDMTDFAPTPL